MIGIGPVMFLLVDSNAIFDVVANIKRLFPYTNRLFCRYSRSAQLPVVPVF